MTQKELFDNLTTALGTNVEISNTSLAAALSDSTVSQITFRYSPIDGTWTAEGQIDPPTPTGPKPNEIWYKTRNMVPINFNSIVPILSTLSEIDESKIWKTTSNEVDPDCGYIVAKYPQNIQIIGVGIDEEEEWTEIYPSFGLFGPTLLGTSGLSEVYDITEVILPQGVTKITPSFYLALTGLTSTDIPSTVTGTSKMGDNFTFMACTGISDIEFKEGLKFLSEQTFYLMNSLSGLTLPESLEIIESNVFHTCPLLTELTYNGSISAWGQINKDNNWLTGSILEVVHCKDGDVRLIPESPTVHEIWYKTTNGASYDINTKNTAFAQSIGVSSSLVTMASSNVQRGNWYVLTYTEPVTELGLKEDGSKMYPSFVPDSFSSLDTIPICAVKLPSGVTTLNPVSFMQTNLTGITIGPLVTNLINAGDAAALLSNNNLQSITVDNANTKYDSRNNCNAIVESSSNTIVFGCKGTVVPDNIKSIGKRAFYMNKAVTSFDFPASVESIGSEAFYYNNNLTSLTFRRVTPPEIESANAFYHVTCDIFVPSNSVDAYKAATYWSDHASQIKPISE